MDEDFFWGDLLALIRRRELVTVVGPDMTLVEVDGREQTLTSLIGQRLVQIYRLTPESEVRTMGDAVALILSECGRDEVYRLYRLIYEIINGRDWKPGKALRDLAAITHLRLFVSTTPDRLLAEAINEIRFAGRRETRELSFSPNKCTSLQRENQSEGSPADTVVLSLFGKAESTTPQYAIHDEDLLEWLCALLSESSSFPEWLSAPLKRRSTLFIGYDIPDWIGRYLLRISGDAPCLNYETSSSSSPGRRANRRCCHSCRTGSTGIWSSESARSRPRLRRSCTSVGKRSHRSGPTTPRRPPQARPTASSVTGPTVDLHQLHAGRCRRSAAAERSHHQARRGRVVRPNTATAG